jgi:hypothetical protein
VRALGFVEFERTGERFEHAVGHAVHVAAFDPGVVRNAHTGENGDFLAAQTGNAAAAVGDQPGLLGRDLRRAGGQKL